MQHIPSAGLIQAFARKSASRVFQAPDPAQFWRFNPDWSGFIRHSPD